MHDKYITRIFATLIVLIIGASFAEYSYALWTGRTEIPPSVVLALAAFIVSVLSAATPWVTSKLMRDHVAGLIQQSDQRTDNRIAQTELKLLNGTGDSIAQRTASLVKDNQQHSDQRDTQIAATLQNTAATMVNTDRLEAATKALEDGNQSR